MRPMRGYIDFPNPREAGATRLAHAFAAPVHTLQAWRPADMRAVLDAVQQAAATGRWCLGWLRYEAAAAFDGAFADAVHASPPDVPLAWFGVHDAPGGCAAGAHPVASHARVQWHPGPDRRDFEHAVDRIHGAIAAGEVYQVNHTALLHGSVVGRAEDLFAALRREQPGGYVAWLDAGTEQVLSVSPELFFDWDGERLLARPMKGTAPRGATPEADAALADALCRSPKERAENVMIVDLLRNDLSRIAELRSVRVPRLFRAEALPAVWQMTSDVEARTRPGTRLADVFAALFPCGSVTGAPKRQAMRLIRALEPGPRGIYCGAIGVVRPGAAPRSIHATFNVPIRTAVVRGDRVQCGIGSGITADSTAAAEWREWRHKRVFLDRASTAFDLLETFALRQGRFVHLERHLARMRTAARHFRRAWPADAVSACLDALLRQYGSGAWRVRLALDAAGRPRAEVRPLAETPVPVRLALASRPLDDATARGEWVRFKTSWRAHYEALAPTAPEVFDTVLHNAAGEITEATRGNVAMLLDGRWVTPPLACGLLPGVGRAVALEEGRLAEGVVRLGDVQRVRGWAFVNSLRGWLPATLAPAAGRS